MFEKRLLKIVVLLAGLVAVLDLDLGLAPVEVRAERFLRDPKLAPSAAGSGVAAGEKPEKSDLGGSLDPSQERLLKGLDDRGDKARHEMEKRGLDKLVLPGAN